MNPWLLAALVFGAIGLVQTAIDNKAADEAAKKVPPKPKKKAKAKSKVVVVETHPQAAPVVPLPSEAPVEVLPPKPAVKVPTE